MVVWLLHSFGIIAKNVNSLRAIETSGEWNEGKLCMFTAHKNKPNLWILRLFQNINNTLRLGINRIAWELRWPLRPVKTIHKVKGFD